MEHFLTKSGGLAGSAQVLPGPGFGLEIWGNPGSAGRSEGRPNPGPGALGGAPNPGPEALGGALSQGSAQGSAQLRPGLRPEPQDLGPGAGLALGWRWAGVLAGVLALGWRWAGAGLASWRWAEALWRYGAKTVRFDRSALRK